MTNPLKPYLTTLYIVVALALVGGGMFAVWSYNDAIKKAERVDALETELGEFKKAQALVNEELARRRNNDNTIRAERAATTNRLETVADEDATAGDYLRTRIPDSVRDAYLNKR